MLELEQTTSVDLLTDCLEQINRFESQVHAWVFVDGEGAAKQAIQLDAELAQGKRRGPLHGLPIAIKDVVDVTGWPTRSGSTLTEGHRAERDATLAARLRAAGAIFLGKTVTTEWACFDPPLTRNPWNLERTPGGSSSGSAAAVALGMCLAAIGTQTGGSITRPASFCGVCGLKPPHGMVSLDGVTPVSALLDHAGPMARSVDDLALLLSVLSGKSFNLPAVETVKPRIMQPEPAFWFHASPEVRDTIERSLGEAGIKEPASLPLPASFAQVHVMHRRIMARDASQVHARAFAAHRDQFSPRITGLIEEGQRVTDAEYDEALNHRRQFVSDMRSMLSACDALLTPATVTIAPGIDTTGDPWFNSPWSYAGVPTVSIPCGLAEDGLPVAVQLVGHPQRLDALINAGRVLQSQLPPLPLPPLS